MPFLVVALDFGTTYSGYAFSFRSDPLAIHANQQWIAGSRPLLSLKTPTCVLVNPEGEFSAFGYDAENKYSQLAEDDLHHGWKLFSRFKMLLHNNKKLTKASTVKDINGVIMPALHIFSMSIRYLKGHFLEFVTKQKLGIKETDIVYVITVPAIWDVSAKQFMREAATLAGIDNARLRIALEPEAASIWCKNVDFNMDLLSDYSGLQEMVIDLGGGTADISVHERRPGGRLKQIHKASGGPWGGMFVDESYLEFLRKLFGGKSIERLKSEEMISYVEILREFETQKRNIHSSACENLSFRIPYSLREISFEETGQKLRDRISSLAFHEKVTLKGKEKLRIDSTLVKRFFDGPVDSVIDHVKKILSDEKMCKVQHILLVGGFSESPYVQERIKSAFSDKHLTIPAEAGLAVLKGAVRFGHEPNIVSSRIMNYTYGVRVARMFDEKIHRQDKLVIQYGKKMVRDIFSVFVRVDEEVGLNEEITRKSIGPMYPTHSYINIYRSVNRHPMYITESGCEKVGQFRIDHPEGCTREDKLSDCTFMFGDTELYVKVKMQQTGREQNLRINCF